jgi:hypothetical protein
VSKINFQLFLIFLFFLPLLSYGQVSLATSQLKKKHIVFDIDWTITSEVKGDFKGKRIIEVEGKKYFVHDGLEEFIEELLTHEDIEISFFSGGSDSRNHALLKQIKLKNGKSLESIAHKILGFNDLTHIEGTKETDRFSVRHKKDLEKITPDLENLYMFDDQQNFALNEKQLEHVLYLGKTFEHFEKYEEARHDTRQYVPKTRKEWKMARNKLYILKSAFEEAYKETEQTGISLSAAMKKQSDLLDFSSGKWNDYSNEMYQKGIRSKQKSVTPCPLSFSKLVLH